MAGEISVPDDFDSLGMPEIMLLFENDMIDSIKAMKKVMSEAVR
ncbi:MAG: hypothetical protein WC560_00210 [Syntrophales bacterium]